MILRSIRLLLNLPLWVLLLSAPWQLSFAGNPSCDPSSPNYDACSCPNPPCSCTSATGGNSIRFTEKISGFISGDSYQTAALNFSHEEPSITMHTVQGINYLSPAAAHIVERNGDFLGTETVMLTLATGDLASSVIFEVADGASVGTPVLAQYEDDYSIRLLDANQAPIADAVPTYIERVDSDETRILFNYSTGIAIQKTDAIGRVYDFSGTDVIRQTGVLRQIRTPKELVDFVAIDHDYEYEIRLYKEGDFGAFDSQTELYPINNGAIAYKVINIKNPAYDGQDIDETHITTTWDGRTTQWRFNYFESNDLWEIEQGELNAGVFTVLRQEAVSRVATQEGTIRYDIKKVMDASGLLLSEHIKKYEDLVGAANSLVSETQDPDQANLVTSYDYYTTGAQTREKKVRHDPNGAWTAWDYDSENRPTLTVEAWNDLTYDASTALSTLATSAKATYSSYAPVDSNDDGSLQPDAARTETVKIEDTVNSITWQAYYRDSNGLYYEITERAASPSASYGDAANLRSEKIYYATTADGENSLRAGRLKSEQSEEGQRMHYDYALDGNGDFTVTRTETHADAPNGLAYQSTRSVRTYDSLANLAQEEMFVYDGSSYQSLDYQTHSYDAERNRTESRRFDGITGGRITYSASYSHGKAISETDASGRTIDTVYDILDRKELETTAGSTAAGVGDISRLYQYSTAATGCGCSASQVTIIDASSTLSMTEVNETDRVKRPSRQVDVNGLETTYSYSNGGRSITQTNPNGSTRITEHYLDGRLKSVTGTGVIAQYYSYGINLDGSTWTRVDTSSASSPRYRTSHFDSLGRLITETSPAADGSTYTITYDYDSYGRLASQSQPGQADSLYHYNSHGQLTRSGLDLDANGQLDLASNDRITDSARNYALESGDWYEVTTTTVYPEAGASTAVTVSTNKRRLSGFTGDLVNESSSIDIHGNSTLRQTEIDRANKTVTQTTDLPSSTINTVRTTINGYLKSQNSATIASSTSYTYDSLGRFVSIQDPRHSQAATTDYYTGTRQIFTQTDAAGHSTSYSYHPGGSLGAGQIASVTDALSQKAYFAYDLLGRQVQSWGQTDYPQAYSYNNYGELASLTTYRDASNSHDFSTATWPNPSGGDTTTWTYQASTGLLSRKEYADGQGTDYSYDSANRLSTRTWARSSGLDTDYSYDASTGELTEVDYENADTTDLTYSYDRLGRHSSITDATGTRSFSYDAATLQLTTENLDSSFYSSHRLSRSYQDGSESNSLPGRAKGYALTDALSAPLSSASYSYDTTGRLSSFTDGTDSFTYSYLTNSNLLASLSAPQHTVAYTYESNRNLMSSIANSVSSSSLSSYTYSYDALGRRSDRAQSGSAYSQSHTDTFTYNTRSEVTSSSNNLLTSNAYTPSYNYDKIGNRSGTNTDLNGSTSYTASQLNQYSTVGSSSPSYDADGNLSSDGTWTYTWNGENRLIEATNGSTTIDFTYDYQGRLVKKDDGSTIETYLYDDWNRIAQYTVNSSFLILNASFNLWGLDLSGSMQGAGGVGGLLKESEFDSNFTLQTSLFCVYDVNGNIMQKLDGTGTTVMAVDYDPFGNIISGSFVGEYGFSTKPLVDDLDWYYYGYRYYDPVTGRWPSRDPLREAGGLNFYGFVGNNPVDWLDLLGLTTLTCAEKARQLAAVGASIINISGRLRDFCGAEIDPTFLEQVLDFNSTVSTGAGAVGAADAIQRALPAGTGSTGVTLDRARGSLMNPNAGRLVNSVGRAAGVVGGVASGVSAVNSFARGDTASGIQASANTALTGIALAVPGYGLGIFAGSLAVNGAVGIYENHLNEGLDAQSRAICERDQNLLQSALDRLSGLEAQECCGQ